MKLKIKNAVLRNLVVKAILVFTILISVGTLYGIGKIVNIVIGDTTLQSNTFGMCMAIGMVVMSCIIICIFVGICTRSFIGQLGSEIKKN